MKKEKKRERKYDDARARNLIYSRTFVFVRVTQETDRMEGTGAEKERDLRAATEFPGTAQARWPGPQLLVIGHAPPTEPQRKKEEEAEEENYS
jgi:hypothetical protein